MFHSSVVVDVSLSPVSISSAAAPYFVDNSMATIVSVRVSVCYTPDFVCHCFIGYPVTSCDD